MSNLQQTINWAKTFIQYQPIQAGFGQEPAISVATMIRNTMLNPPMTWHWNRSYTLLSTIRGQQDYIIPLADFGFLEKANLTDISGKIWQVKDVYNTVALSQSTDQQRPEAISVEGFDSVPANVMTITNIAISGSNVLTVTVSSGASLLFRGESVALSGLTTATFLNGQTVQVLTVTGDTAFTANFTHATYGSASDTGSATPPTTGIVFRFLGVPDGVYSARLTYQRRPQAFGPFVITAAGNAASGNTTYTGTFDPQSFPMLSYASITGFVNAVNNGLFQVVSCTATSLVVANASGVSQSGSAFVSNFDWAPIPDWFSDVYNNLFISEMLSNADDARSTVYRQRGVAAFLAKAQGLTDMQKSMFLQQWSQRGMEANALALKTQLGTQARSI